MLEIKKYIFFCLILSLCIACACESLADTCSKPKVAVNMQLVDENEFIKYLDEKYPSQPKASWLHQIQEKVLSELRMNSPDIEFIPVSGALHQDCDYSFSYGLCLIGAGEDIEIGGVPVSEYIAFWMDSSLVQKNACGFPGNILNVEITKDDQDIFRTVERNIAAYGSIRQRIEEYEESHRVPPRGPEIEVSLDKKYVSPVKGERELDIKIDVKNCKGQPVFDKYHGQEVILPRKTSRGEIKPTKGFSQDSVVTDNLVLLKITHPEGASATYSLKKGMDLDFDQLKILTCGIDKKVVKDVMPPISIAGMGIEVIPRDVYISPGESTQIDIELFKVMPWGGKWPVPGQRIEVTVQGLVDGSVSPMGQVRTNEGGKATLTYRAGEIDKDIRICARYQPEEYPDSIQDDSTVILVEKKKCWRVTVEMFTNYQFEHQDKKENQRGWWVREEYSTKSSYDIHIMVRFYQRSGEQVVIEAKDISGSYHYESRTFDQSADADCRGKGIIRPGGWQSAEQITTGELVDEGDPRIYSGISINRFTNAYSFNFNIGGLWWKYRATRRDTHYDACTGTTSEENYGPYEMKKESGNIGAFLRYRGQAINLNKFSGSETFTDIIGTVTTYKWTIERVECEKD